MTTLIAGPWVGEFGWELFAWQAYLRSMSVFFDKTVIISRTKSKSLYDDFCDEFISFDKVTGLSDSFFMYNFDFKKEAIKILKDSNISLKDITLLMPRRIGIPPYTHYKDLVKIGEYPIKPNYIRFGQPEEKKIDYIFHIRNRKLREKDNWSIDNWLTLREIFKTKKIACVGTTKESGWIEGTEDLRDIPLNDLFNTFYNAKCAFGPSSGPMHLASLCGCPHVVWSRKENLSRYTDTWNPLETPILFDSKFSWHPKAEYIADIFNNWSFE
jgi:hypothetical protein